jgi:hypothetical protein
MPPAAPLSRTTFHDDGFGSVSRRRFYGMPFRQRDHPMGKHYGVSHDLCAIGGTKRILSPEICAICGCLSSAEILQSRNRDR